MTANGVGGYIVCVSVRLFRRGTHGMLWPQDMGRGTGLFVSKWRGEELPALH